MPATTLRIRARPAAAGSRCRAAEVEPPVGELGVVAVYLVELGHVAGEEELGAAAEVEVYVGELGGAALVVPQYWQGEQSAPQSMSSSSPFLRPSSHVLGWHLPAKQVRFTQSPPTSQPCPSVHRSHNVPPQSISVSIPFLMPSLQLGPAQRLSSPQTPLKQSLPILQGSLKAHPSHGPPQSVAVLRWIHRVLRLGKRVGRRRRTERTLMMARHSLPPLCTPQRRLSHCRTRSRSGRGPPL